MNLPQCLKLVVFCLYLCDVTNHRMQFVVRDHFVRINYYGFLYSFVIFGEIINDKLEFILIFYEGVAR